MVYDKRWVGRLCLGRRKGGEGTYEAVELVCHGGGVDGLVGEVVERRRKAVVV